MLCDCYFVVLLVCLSLTFIEPYAILDPTFIPKHLFLFMYVRAGGLACTLCACMLWHVLCASVCGSVWVWVCDKMYSARKLLFSCTQMECVELVMHLMDDFFFPPVGHQDPNCGQTRAISIQTPCRRFRAQDAAGENKENGHLMMTLLT